MVFVGVTRFSLFKPDSVAWRSSRHGAFSNAEDYKSYLFAPERLDPRMKILSEISLPNIALAAEAHTVRHIIQYSPELPCEYIQQLKELARRYPFVVLSDSSDKSGETHPYTVANTLNPEQRPYVIYRLDDDDFLSTRYFDQLAPLVTEANLGYRISLAAGLTGVFDGETFSTIRYSYRPYIAIGLAGIYGRNSEGSFIAPPEAAHNRSDRVGTVLVNAEQCSYFWTRHSGQDTDFGTASDFEATRRGVEACPPVPADWDVLESFPALSGKVDTFSRVGIVNDMHVPSHGLDLELQATGRFSVILDATFPEGMLSNSGLISFDIQRQGAPIDNIEIAGMTLSPNKDIGQYRYISTYPGRRSNQFDFELPHGCEVVGARIMPFGPQGRPFTVHAMDLLC